jgi:hypothetical protein
MPVAETDRQVRSGADKPQRVEAPLIEGRGALAQPVDVGPPRGDRVGLVEPRRGDDGVPQALHVGLPEDRASPAVVRVADDRPLDEPPVLGVEQLLGGEACPRALRPTLVEIGEELGLRLARDRDRGAARVDHVVEECERPGR